MPDRKIAPFWLCWCCDHATVSRLINVVWKTGLWAAPVMPARGKLAARHLPHEAATCPSHRADAEPRLHAAPATWRPDWLTWLWSEAESSAARPRLPW